MTFRGLDLYADPGPAALADLKAQGFSWVAAYLEAPSHGHSSWRSYPELAASGLNVVPIWVGGQITGRGSYRVSGPAGAAEATACLAELQAKGYPAGHGVAFDTENGAPIPPNQAEHLISWGHGIRAGGRRAICYGSHENQDALAAIFGAENVWCWDLRAGSDQSPIAPIVQYQQNTTVTAADQTIPCDLDVSLSEDPAGALMAAQPIIAAVPPAPAPPPTKTPVQVPISTVPPLMPPPPKQPIIQTHGPIIAAAATAAAAAGAGATGATTHVIDFTALINALAPYIITGIVLPIAIWLAGRAMQYFHIQMQSAAGQIVVKAVENGVNALAAEGVSYADAHANVDVHDAYLASVLAYARTAVPQRLAQSGITPDQLAALATNRLAQIGATTS